MTAYAVKAVCALIRVYQVTVSPLLGPRCRFHPNCSSYAIEALHRHGPFAGLWLALRRLGRCQPWGGSGFDPVPDALDASASHHSSHHAL